MGLVDGLKKIIHTNRFILNDPFGQNRQKKQHPDIAGASRCYVCIQVFKASEILISANMQLLYDVSKIGHPKGCVMAIAHHHIHVIAQKWQQSEGFQCPNCIDISTVQCRPKTLPQLQLYITLQIAVDESLRNQCLYRLLNGRTST